MVIIKLKGFSGTMPKCCHECPFGNVSGDFDTIACDLLERYIGYYDDENLKNKRLDDCPIVSVEHISENEEKDY